MCKEMSPKYSLLLTSTFLLPLAYTEEALAPFLSALKYGHQTL